MSILETKRSVLSLFHILVWNKHANRPQTTKQLTGYWRVCELLRGLRSDSGPEESACRGGSLRAVCADADVKDAAACAAPAAAAAAVDNRDDRDDDDGDDGGACDAAYEAALRSAVSDDDDECPFASTPLPLMRRAVCVW